MTFHIMTPLGQTLLTIAGFAICGTSAAMTRRQNASYAVAKQRATLLVGAGFVVTIASLFGALLAG